MADPAGFQPVIVTAAEETAYVNRLWAAVSRLDDAILPLYKTGVMEVIASKDPAWDPDTAQGKINNARFSTNTAFVGWLKKVEAHKDGWNEYQSGRIIPWGDWLPNIVMAGAAPTIETAAQQTATFEGQYYDWFNRLLSEGLIPAVTAREDISGSRPVSIADVIAKQLPSASSIGSGASTLVTVGVVAVVAYGAYKLFGMMKRSGPDTRVLGTVSARVR